MKRRDFLRYGAIGLTAATPSILSPKRTSDAGGAGEIVRCVIHPAIGVARVGNSPDELFLGPEVPGPHPMPAGGFKDPAGRIKRQAARFRIYALDAAGRVVSEITAAEAEIHWTVELANTKAAWYEFEFPFDIPEALGRSSQPDGAAGEPLVTPRRNASVTGADRSTLAITPGPRTIAGASTNPNGAERRFAFDGGRFFDIPVPLGELRTDEAGRLLVLGGLGVSGPSVPGRQATTFANNDGWYDDTSDGPIEATVRIGGRTIQAEGAWVVVAPPNYAPGIQSIVTLYDLLFEVGTRLGGVHAPPLPSFTRQIYPLLARHTEHQWVNAGFLRDFGWGAPGSFTDPDTPCAFPIPLPRVSSSATMSSAGSATRATCASNMTRCLRTTATPHHSRLSDHDTGWRCCRISTPGCDNGLMATSRRIGRRAARALSIGWRICRWMSSPARSIAPC